MTLDYSKLPDKEALKVIKEGFGIEGEQAWLLLAFARGTTTGDLVSGDDTDLTYNPFVTDLHLGPRDKRHGNHNQKSHGSWGAHNPFHKNKGGIKGGGSSRSSTKSKGSSSKSSPESATKPTEAIFLRNHQDSKGTYNPNTGNIAFARGSGGGLEIAAAKKAYPNAKTVTVDGKTFNIDAKPPSPSSDKKAKAPKSKAHPLFKSKKSEPEAKKPSRVAPVSDALLYNSGDMKRGAGVDAAVDSINKVHTDGKLPPIPVVEKDILNLGQYFPGFPQSIEINPDGDHPAMTMAHETGHFLDNQGLNDKYGSFGSSSRNSPKMSKLMSALHNSDAVKQLKDMRDDPEAHAVKPPGASDNVPREFWIIPDKNYTSYSVRPEELFARAYAQHIAQKSGNPIMKKELGELLEQQRFPTQWQPEDFSDISKAFDELFQERGWI